MKGKSDGKRKGGEEKNKVMGPKKSSEKILSDKNQVSSCSSGQNKIRMWSNHGPLGVIRSVLKWRIRIHRQNRYFARTCSFSKRQMKSFFRCKTTSQTRKHLFQKNSEKAKISASDRSITVASALRAHRSVRKLHIQVDSEFIFAKRSLLKTSTGFFWGIKIFPPQSNNVLW